MRLLGALASVGLAILAALRLAGRCAARPRGAGGRRAPGSERHRDARRSGLRPAVVWLTGLPSSGKSTIARAVLRALADRGLEVEHLDGDAIRALFPGTGFGRADRDAHVKRVGYLASRLEEHGVFVVASLVSPYAESRDFVRSLCRNFVEVYVSTPLEECERRDAKGLYARARRGEIGQFTGIDDPYEPPAQPDLTIDTREVPVAAACAMVMRELAART